MKLKIVFLALTLGAGVAGAAPQTTVQDGIEVRELSRFRHLAPKSTVEEGARQQYMQLLNEAETKHALLPDTDPRVIRVRAIAKRIIPFGTRWNPDAARWKWQVNVLASPTVNAFCMPGGYIAFFSGIIDKLKMTDDEIAAVMGHEVAHALREHSREQMGKNLATNVLAQGLGALFSYKTGADPHATSQVARMGAGVAGLKYSRDDEREADLVGLDLAARAGYDPRAGIVLWQKMGALSKSAPPALLSTHPLGPERIEKIQEHLNVLMPVYAKTKGVAVDKLPPYQTNR